MWFVSLSSRMVKGLDVEHPSHRSCWELLLHTQQEVLSVDLQIFDTAQALQLLTLGEVSVFRAQLGQEQVRLWLMSDPAGAQIPLGQKHHFTLFNLFTSDISSTGDRTYLCQNPKLGAFKQHFN